MTAARRLRHGDEIPTGVVYRRLPNWATYYDEAERRADAIAFMPNEGHAEASAQLDEADARAEVAKRPGFGLMALDVERIREATGGRVKAIFTPTRNTPSHVSLTNCIDEDLRERLAAIADVVIPPGGLKPRPTPKPPS